MSDPTLTRTVTIANPQGLHLRPAAAFAKAASAFQCNVTLQRGTDRVNGKSPLELILLAAEHGTELKLEVSGADAATALDTLAEILANPGEDANEARSPTSTDA